MKTMLIAAAAALALSTGAAFAASPTNDALAAPVGGQSEVASINAAPAGFYRGTAAYEAQASIARYVATHQGTATPGLVGSVNLPQTSGQQGNG